MRFKVTGTRTPPPVVPPAVSFEVEVDASDLASAQRQATARFPGETVVVLSAVQATYTPRAQATAPYGSRSAVMVEGRDLSVHQVR